MLRSLLLIILCLFPFGVFAEAEYKKEIGPSGGEFSVPGIVTIKIPKGAFKSVSKLRILIGEPNKVYPTTYSVFAKKVLHTSKEVFFSSSLPFSGNITFELQIPKEFVQYRSSKKESIKTEAYVNGGEFDPHYEPISFRWVNDVFFEISLNKNNFSNESPYVTSVLAYVQLDASP